MKLWLKSHGYEAMETRLHSSGMRTTRLLTVSPSMHCTGGCLPREGVSVRGSAQGGLPRAVCPGGVSASDPGGGCIPACNEANCGYLNKVLIKTYFKTFM